MLPAWQSLEVDPIGRFARTRDGQTILSIPRRRTFESLIPEFRDHGQFICRFDAYFRWWILDAPAGPGQERFLKCLLAGYSLTPIPARLLEKARHETVRGDGARRFGYGFDTYRFRLPREADLIVTINAVCEDMGTDIHQEWHGWGCEITTQKNACHRRIRALADALRFRLDSPAARVLESFCEHAGEPRERASKQAASNAALAMAGPSAR